MSFRPYPVLSILTLISLGILLWLGNWQYGRYSEKMGLRDVVPEWTTLEGVTHPAAEIMVYSYVDGQSAWRRVVPVERKAPDAGIIMVTAEVIYSIDPPQPCGLLECGEGAPFSMEGVFIVPSGRSAFTGADDPEARIFYAYDTGVIGNAVGQVIETEAFEPRTVSLTEGSVSQTLPNPFARVGNGDELPPQRHFGYAITWWGLAIALLGIYLALHWSQGRIRFRRGEKT